MTWSKCVSVCLLVSSLFYKADAQLPEKIVISLDENKTYQTIQNFAASDAWACQFAGNWSDGKRNAIADWLFSMDTLPNGNPKGIGLSMWRYNLGAGSAEQNDSSGIRDEWRRASATGSNSSKVKAQNWFLQAAKQRGVQQFLGFFNSPPVQLTRNGKAYAYKGNCNIDSLHYKDFADYTVNTIKNIKQTTGVTFDYVSPVNEPQWDWSDGGQEGCPYSNYEISGVIKAFNTAFQQHHLQTKLLVSESGDLKYLLPANDKKDKDNQVHDFFNPGSLLYIGNLPAVANAIASHSYFTTSPFSKVVALRTAVKDSVSQINNLCFWQSEYCILGDNAGEIDGSKKDLGMDAALYLAKVMYEDLAISNASAWQWWTALSAYDYKDGLVYIDKNETDGNISDSKMMWAMGNYSRFVRPGMKRVEAIMPAVKDMYFSAYKDDKRYRLVCVMVNEVNAAKSIELNKLNAYKKAVLYITDEANNLAKQELTGNIFTVPAKSVTTVVIN